MWKKPLVDMPDFENKNLVELTEAESVETSGSGGGLVGSCLALGYTCWSKGGFKAGVCLIVGAWF